MHRKTIITTEYQSPCGTLVVGSIGNRLCLCDWTAEPRHVRIRKRLAQTFKADFKEGTSSVIETAVLQLDNYFAGTRTCTDIPLQFAGTDFQKTVWTKLLKIPYGSTISYGNLAKSIGTPTAVRAVAGAVGANAISIFIPCHRIIGSDGSLTGYAGSLSAKQYLLNLEKR